MSTLPMGTYVSQADKIKRQRLYADYLRKQGGEEQSQGSYTHTDASTPLFGKQGEIYVAPDWSQQLLHPMQNVLGSIANNQANQAEDADTKAQVEDSKRVLSSLPKTTGVKTTPAVTLPAGQAGPVMPEQQTPYKLTEDEYAGKMADFSQQLSSSQNPMLAGIRDKVMLNALDAPEKMYAREDRQKAADDAYKLKQADDAVQAQIRREDKATESEKDFVRRKELQTQHESLIAAIANMGSVDKRYGIDNRASGSGVNNPMSYSPELLTAINEGRVPMSGLNSRTAPLYDQLAKNNPTGDFTKIKMDQVLGNNANFQGKNIGIQAMPEILHNVKTAGQAIDFPENVPAAVVKQKWLQVIKDPAYTGYMTQRNDALLTIANTMRGTGMSDFATKLEEEVASPTMSPKQLDAWMEGQMKSLKPRLDAANKATHTTPKALPNSNKTVTAHKIVNGVTHVRYSDGTEGVLP